MGRLRWVGSLNLFVSNAEYRLFYRALSQKRPIILRTASDYALPHYSSLLQQTICREILLWCGSLSSDAWYNREILLWCGSLSSDAWYNRLDAGGHCRRLQYHIFFSGRLQCHIWLLHHIWRLHVIFGVIVAIDISGHVSYMSYLGVCNMHFKSYLASASHVPSACHIWRQWLLMLAGVANNIGVSG